MNVGAAGMRRTTPGKPWAELTGRDRHAAALVAARAGDKSAFGTLVTELTSLVWHVARGNGLDPVTAEDVVQTVWLRLVENVDRLTEPRSLTAWLITTARREALWVQRRATRELPLEDDVAEGVVDTEPTPEEVVVRAERDRELRLAFSKLSSRAQEVLRLTVGPGRVDYREVSERLGVPVGSIGPMRSRALAKLRDLYHEAAGSSAAANRFLPLSERLTPAATTAAVHAWRLGSGQLVLPVYTTQNRLADALGAGKPWSVVTAERLPDLLAATPARRFVTDSMPDAVGASWETVRVNRHAVPMIGSPEPHTPALRERPVSDSVSLNLADLLEGHGFPAVLMRALAHVSQVRITPTEVTFDGETVPWDRVTQIRTRPLADYLQLDAVREQVTGIPMPVFPGRRQVLARLADAMLRQAVAIADDELNQRNEGVYIAAEVEYRGALGRRKTMHADALTALLLADQAVRDRVAATAQRHGVLVLSSAADLDDTERLALAREHLRELTATLTSLRGANTAD